MFLDTHKKLSECLTLPIDNINTKAQYWEKFEQACRTNNCMGLHDYFSNKKGIFNHVFSISSFLSENIIHDITFYNEIYNAQPHDTLKEIFQKTKALGKETDQKIIMKNMRLYKSRVATLCGLMDILDIWSVMQITKNLSDFASLCCHATLNHCLFVLKNQNILTLNNLDDPATHSGFCILGMGKLGGEELNYSSDIDLIAFYDIDKIQCDDSDKLREKVVKIFKSFITILEHPTADGYVFRTDFRLRPNPSMTPIIMTNTAMLQYYETMGLNWERSAMIKARPVAGNIEVGNDFLHEIRSFIWRKNLDFMALEDIYTIKNKINTHRSNFDLNLYGHNVKLGVGGIREIEFLTQSQQLIWGGRVTSLRGKKTLQTLTQLVKHGHVKQQVATTLSSAYLYHRKLEHRLQMIRDEQTHTLPESDEKMLSISRFMGYDSIEEFHSEAIIHFQNVATIYTNLFKDKNIGKDQSSIKKYIYSGFENEDAIKSIFAHWQGGTYRATRSEKSRQLLGHLETHILDAFRQTANPDEAIATLDKFLERLPAGVQLFSLFKSNPTLLNLLAHIMGNAPRLSERLVQMPNLLDSLITGQYKHDVMDSDALYALLQTHLKDANDYQDILEITRRFKAEFFFEQAIRLLENLATPHDITGGLSHVANTVLKGLIPNSLKNMQYNAGIMHNGKFAILAFGKLGGMEMTHRSDVDLVFVYDHPDQNQKSTGKRALGSAQYYTGLCQRIITGIASMTSNGHLFETDMRLRPHGNSGSMATNLTSFETYYKTNQAWTWEEMALTRARVLYSSHEDLTHSIETIIQDTLCQPRQKEALFNDVATMRRKVQDEFYDGVKWYIKHRPGGLFDVEFIAQTLQLQHAHKHPSITKTNTLDCYEALLQKGIIDTPTHKTLTEALVLWHNIQGILRLTTMGRFHEADATTGQLDALLKCTGHANIAALHETMDTLTLQVRNIFNTLLEKEI